MTELQISSDEIKKIELSILDYIDDVCRANHIKYYLARGKDKWFRIYPLRRRENDAFRAALSSGRVLFQKFTPEKVSPG